MYEFGIIIISFHTPYFAKGRALKTNRNCKISSFRLTPPPSKDQKSKNICRLYTFKTNNIKNHKFLLFGQKNKNPSISPPTIKLISADLSQPYASVWQLVWENERN